MKHPNLPTVVIVGRANVGKSTLFNRLLERSKALVSPISGTTRDRNEGDCLWRGKMFRLIDTGGLDIDKHNSIEREIEKQAEIAMKEADLILFMVDLKGEPLPEDLALASRLWKTKTPILVVGNKAEKASERSRAKLPQWRLRGLPAPMAISSIQGSGTGDLLDVIFDKLMTAKKPPIDYEKVEAIRVAVIGKPNVGKSTLLNALLGEERFITSPIAHTTREPNDTLITVNGKNYVFVDTAGMRKNSKVKKAGGLEATSVERNEFVIRTSDVCLLIVDATEPIGSQEKTLAGIIKQHGTGVIVIVNKWDLVKDKETNTMNHYKKYLAAAFPFLTWAPVLFVSALTKQRTHSILNMVDDVQKHRFEKYSNKALEFFLEEAIRQHIPSRGKGALVPKILGMKQVSVAPPTFDLTLKAKRTDSLHPSYLRFLENRLREQHDLTGTPIHINIRIATAVSN